MPRKLPKMMIMMVLLACMRPACTCREAADLQAEGGQGVSRQRVRVAGGDVPVAQAPSVGRCLEKSEHVVARGPEDELGSHRAVFVGEESPRFEALVGNGPSANGVLKVELVFPSGAQHKDVSFLLDQPIAQGVEVVVPAAGGGL